jgi:hypothetical protein
MQSPIFHSRMDDFFEDIVSETLLYIQKNIHNLTVCSLHNKMKKRATINSNNKKRVPITFKILQFVCEINVILKTIKKRRGLPRKRRSKDYLKVQEIGKTEISKETEHCYLL